MLTIEADNSGKLVPNAKITVPTVKSLKLSFSAIFTPK